MAPALTQTGEPPPNLVDTATTTTACPIPDPSSTATSLLPYDDLKAITKTKNLLPFAKDYFEPEHLIVANGDRVSSGGLAPPASGWAEGRPLPSASPRPFCNMDEQPPLPPLPPPPPLLNARSSSSSSSGGHPPPPPPPINLLSNDTMGLPSCVTELEAAAAASPLALEKQDQTTTTNVLQDDSTNVLSNQNELLALVGRDFDNVNDIIDTLQRLASNPELLDAAARELEPESTAASATAASPSGGVPVPTQPPHTETAGQQQQQPSPAEQAAFILGHLADRQRRLERKRLFLLRRLRRITGRGLAMTVSGQMTHVTRHVRRVLDDQRASSRLPEPEKIEEPIGLELLHKESMKAMSTSDLISLVRRVEASNNHRQQRLNELKARKMCEDRERDVVWKLPSSLCAEIETVSSEMKAAALTHAAHDSDATESSSGGESSDETEAFRDVSTNCKPIHDRAFYKYCRMRGWVASRWMWLQAQLADLNYKIVQQQRIHSHIVKSKGAIQLSEEAKKGGRLNPPVPPRNPAHLDRQDPALTCIGSAVPPRTILNGYHPSNKVAEDLTSLHGWTSEIGVMESLSSGCSRTLGTDKVKRRRYVRPNVTLYKRGIPSSTNKVNPVTSTSLCDCVPPLTCILCDVKTPRNTLSTINNNSVHRTGHHHHPNSSSSSSKQESVFLVDHFLKAAKLSKVDQAFHPVLSSHTEMLQGEIYCTILKSSEWRHKALAANKLLLQTLHQKADGLTNYHGGGSGTSHYEPPLAKRKKEKEHKRNGRRRHNRDDGRDRGATLASRRNVIEDEAAEGDGELNSCQVTMSGSSYPSPCPSPALPDKGAKNDGNKGAGGGLVETKNNRKPATATTASRQKQNSTSNSYDINNIVIPYSMAASSRVELLQYKDIPTPKWRVEEIPPMSMSSKRNTEFMEDISDEAVTSRHSRSEEMERKKFLQYLHTQSNTSRSTRSRRADSSGTNTPDHPLSPRPVEPMECSPVGSPPGTPLTMMSGPEEATVLTFSLSSLNSSLLKSDPPAPPSLGESEENGSSTIHASSAVRCHPKGHSGSTIEEGVPSMRTRRSLSNAAQQADKLRSLFQCEEQQCEKDRVSPFPYRDFPLNEADLRELVSSENQSTNPSPNQVLTRSSLKANQSLMSSSSNTVLQGTNEEPPPAQTSIGTDEESGRDSSPLSELTDSAPEEEGPWDEETTTSPPAWTISAVNDPCGGFVLTVHRN